MRSFLQTREWAEIEQRDGHAARRIQFGDETCLAFKRTLLAGFYYYYVPSVHIRESFVFWEAMRKFGKLSHALFVRLELLGDLSKVDGIRTYSVRTVQPQTTLITNIARSDEELLAGMHSKTRYNIRLAEKHGVTIEQRAGSDAIDDFYALLARTSRRDGFRPHPRAHYENLLGSNSHTFRNELIFARVGDRLAAAALVNFCDGTATYLHGASDHALRQSMAPYLLHWCIMQKARAGGLHEYDWHGIDEERWPGVTRFKRGFGGREVRFPGAFDIVFRPAWYAVYQVVRRALQLL